MGFGWLGITWDEGPFFQGEYAARHQADAERLLAEGKAYRCFCTREELDAQRSQAEAAGLGFRYDRRCRNLPAAEVARRMREGAPSTIRFLMDDDGDRLGRRRARPDQFPGAGPRRLRDSAERQQRHLQPGRRVRRHRHGDHPRDPGRRSHLEHPEADRALPCAGPRAAGLRPRADDSRDPTGRSSPSGTAPPRWATTRTRGFFPPPCGISSRCWAGRRADDREILSPEQMVQLFSLEGIQKKAAVFDTTKLEWMNGQYLSALPVAELEPPVRRQLEQMDIRTDRDLRPLIDSVKARSRTILHVAEQVAVRLDPSRSQARLQGRGLTPEDGSAI